MAWNLTKNSTKNLKFSVGFWVFVFAVSTFEHLAGPGFAVQTVVIDVGV